MPYYDKKVSFTSGEIDPKLIRPDMVQTFHGLDKARNVFIQPQGGIIRRYGLKKEDVLQKYVSSVLTDADPTTDNVTFVEFPFNIDQKYLVIFLVETIHIYREVSSVWTKQTSIETTYTNDEVAKLTFAHNLDSMLIFTNTHETRQLQRQGSHTSWALSEWVYRNVPKRNFSDTVVGSSGFEVGVDHQEQIKLYNLSDGDRFSIFVNGEETAPITHRTTVQSAVDHVHQLGLFDNGGADHDYTICVNGEETGLITYDETDLATSASDMQTALQALSGLSSVTVSNTGGTHDKGGDTYQEFDITFGGADGGTFYSIVSTVEDVHGLDLRIHETTTTVGQPAIASTVDSIAAEIGALSVVTSEPTVTSITTTKFLIIMEGEGDTKQEWKFLEGNSTIDSDTGDLAFLTIRKGKKDKEDSWSLTGDTPRGYPRCGTFYQGRLYVAGSTDLPQTLWGSVVNDFENFDTTLTDDNYGIEVDGDTNTVSTFVNLYSGHNLQIFGSESEFYVPTYQQSPITPESISLRLSSERGAKEGVALAESNGKVLFVQANGDTVYNSSYDEGVGLYRASEISNMAPHLSKGIQDLSYLHSNSIEDSSYIFLIDENNDLPVLNSLPEENISAWSKIETDGDFLATETVGESALFAVGRTLNGVNKIILESFDKDTYGDCAVRAEGVSVTEVTSGLSHLEGHEVMVMVDGLYYGTETVTSGTVSFVDWEGNPLTVSSWEIGLDFPIVDGRDGVVWARTLPLHLQGQQGSILATKIRIHQIDLTVIDTGHLMVRHDMDYDISTNLPRNNVVKFVNQQGIFNADAQVYSGDARVEGLLGWSKNGRVSLVQKALAPSGLNVTNLILKARTK